MSAAIIILWRPGDPWRERLYSFTRPRWEALGVPIVEADDPRGLFAARNAGARAAGAWDVALFTDADIALADPSQALLALDLAADGGYITPFSDLVSLGRKATEQALAGAALESVKPWKRLRGSWVGAFAIGRKLFDEIGGYDERFAPYSGQDIAIIHAASTLGRLGRAHGLAAHLWHPRGGDQIGHPPSGHPTLWPRYVSASGNPAAMRELLAR